MQKRSPRTWPGHIPAGQVSNDIISLQDWLPTLMAAVGEHDIKGKLLKHPTKMAQPYTVHLDGYNFLPYLTKFGTKQQIKSPRKEYFYLTDNGYPSALRYEDWKLIFSEQRAEGFDVWSEPFVKLRVPLILNLRRDPFEKAPEEAENYIDWRFRRTYLLGPGQLYMSKLLDTFREYPPRQEPPSFSVEGLVDDLVEDLKMGGTVGSD